MSDEEVFAYLWHAPIVAIVGSRFAPITLRERVWKLIGKLDLDTVIVTGGAPGVDTWAEDIAVERGMACAVVRPSNKGIYQRSGYFARNTVIVQAGDIVVAFWDGKSHGTLDDINKAISYHEYCVVVLDGKNPEVWRGAYRG